MIIGNSKRGVDRGQLRLSAPADSVVTNKNTYQKISGTFTDGESFNFSVSANKLKFNGADNSVFLFNGSSELRVDKITEITYALYKNGQIIADTETPHTFVALAKTSSIGITAIIKLNNGDELDVYVKTGDDNITISVKTLNIALWGEK